MRIVFALVLFLGVSIAGGAVYVASQQFSANQARINELSKRVVKNVELKKVYIAARELTYGQILTAEDVKQVEWPKNAIPKTAFSDALILFGDATEEDKRIVIRTVDAGELLLSTKVTKLGEDAGVASRLQKGMRAFTLRVDVASGVSGFLRPGDKIDIYWTGDVTSTTDIGRRTEKVTRLIMDGIKLVAIDQSASESNMQATVAKTVTVAVSPQTVASLVQAQATGKLLLSLRGVNDETTSEAIEVTQNQLLGRTERTQQKAVAEKICTIKTRKGSEVIAVPIACSN